MPSSVRSDGRAELNGGWELPERERDGEARAASGRVGRRHLALVRGDDAGDDRQAQPGAGPALLAPALRAPEAPEQVLRVPLGQAGAVVADLEVRARLVA